MAVVGGKELNEITLRNFYTFHTAVIPMILLLLVLYHFWRVRKAGGVLLPDDGEDVEKVPVMPHLVFKEFIVALVLLAFLLLLSALFDAPLLEKANPSYSMNPTKAPWYFAGVQELLMHFHPFFAAFIIPAAVIIFLAWIPYLEFEEEPAGTWFLSERGKRSSVTTAYFAVAVTVCGILFNAYIFDFEVQMPGIPALISNGIIPLLILGALIYAYYRYYLRQMSLAVSEKVQAAFVFLMVAFIILTLTGVFFRSKDMELAFPWNVLS
jgi:quinol-cytochrome oxidoreductase complex cytochrome b subunit